MTACFPEILAEVAKLDNVTVKDWLTPHARIMAPHGSKWCNDDHVIFIAAETLEDVLQLLADGLRTCSNAHGCHYCEYDRREW
jgi:hypothetical protein